MGLPLTPVKNKSTITVYNLHSRHTTPADSVAEDKENSTKQQHFHSIWIENQTKELKKKIYLTNSTSLCKETRLWRCRAEPRWRAIGVKKHSFDAAKLFVCSLLHKYLQSFLYKELECAANIQLLINRELPESTLFAEVRIRQKICSLLF